GYCSTVVFNGDLIEVGLGSPLRIQPLSWGAWTPISSIVDPPNNRIDWMFYPESWLMTHYLLRTPGRQQQLTDYLNALRVGSEPAVAFKAAFKMDYHQFQ